MGTEAAHINNLHTLLQTQMTDAVTLSHMGQDRTTCTKAIMAHRQNWAAVICLVISTSLHTKTSQIWPDGADRIGTASSVARLTSRTLLYGEQQDATR
jgi:hypothetical protein